MRLALGLVALFAAAPLFSGTAPAARAVGLWTSIIAPTNAVAAVLPRSLDGWDRLPRRSVDHAPARTRRPYASSSVWNRPVPDRPRLADHSAGIIATQFDDDGLQHVQIRSQEAGMFDYGHPVYFASTRDPVVRIDCVKYCDREDHGGLPSSIHIPARARAAGGEDSHMAVIQPDMTEIDFFGVRAHSGEWGDANHRSIVAGAAQNCGSFVSGNGFNDHGTVTVAGACVAAGLLRADELASGRIHHALFLIVNCAAPAAENVYPVRNGAGTDVCRDRSKPAPPLGARLWLDYTDAEIAALPAKRWEKAILYALHDYGGYICDDISGGDHVSGVYFQTEGGDAFRAFGVADPYSRIGWSPVRVLGSLDPRYIGADPWRPQGIDFQRHLHYVHPCVTERTC